ncbi:serine/threonine protein kinase [Desulfuromonas sp. KJ2020]|uniref:serine/threonine-protein kinase n=1 Tax=Desulfuromonas sp. KJ2020 TaxID=2919173 RepID=UPI0020A6F686|nr:serine/threonine-protein kinase [Desulfuromonas sp. KJ2020]MCP3176401.1 serine/threonine protein kinase [Desulfuromonas sp. KJ2020]
MSNETLISLPADRVQRLKTGAADSLFLLRSPRALLRGLQRKWLVPVLLLASLVLVPLMLLPATHFLLEKIYPPVEKKQLFGLLKTSKEDERLARRKAQSTLVIWSLAGLGVATGLVLYAPIIRRAAEQEILLQPPKQLTNAGRSHLEERYRIDAEIGSGTMGVVYSAFDQTLERQVALKELPAVFVRDPERRERFRREALTLAQLTHPGIVQIYDLFDDGSRLILVMELIRGGTLEDHMAGRAPFAEAEALGMVAQIGDTLCHVHEKGIVHRDLKPANILLDEQQRLKVTDFGLARLVRESGLTLDGSLMGTPYYMSPEQASGKPTDFRADIYSLGVIFYELLAGSPPFSGEPAAVLLQQITDEPPPLQERVEGLRQEVADLVMAMLRKDPDERLCDHREISRRLQELRS